MRLQPDMAALRQEGYLASDSAVARVVERFGLPGSEDYPRVLEASVAGGFSFEVLPSRGFDVGRLEYGGFPLAWLSPVSDRRSLDVPVASQWLSRFNGGFMATCGLRHFGQPTASEGLHGDIGHLPASDIAYRSARTEPRVELTANVNATSLFGISLTLSRRIISGLADDGRPYLEIEDSVVNTGLKPATAMIMYHLNFGAPLILPGTTVDFVRSTGRSTSSVIPPLTAAAGESVRHHGVIDVDGGGYARCRIASPCAWEVEVAWTGGTLPHAHQWTLSGRGLWALAIEPATGPLEAADAGSTPPLQPGEARRYGVKLAVV